jgi:hypothetical protein
MITYDKLWKYNTAAFIICLIVAVVVGIAYSQGGMSDNEMVLSQFPSDGTAYNEIHRYYADCGTFGTVAGACYGAGYEGATKGQISDKLAKLYWVMAQGQVDVCNMMYNKGTYDQYMGKDMEDPEKLGRSLATMCYDALLNIDGKSFEKSYGTQNK